MSLNSANQYGEYVILIFSDILPSFTCWKKQTHPSRAL